MSSSLVVLAICTVLQTTDGGFAQVVVATPDRRRRSPIFADVGKGAIDIELMRESLVTLTSRCDEEGFALIGNECSPCPSGATCPGGHFACFRQILLCIYVCCIAGGGRVWPNEGFWNRGEMSGFVSRCAPSLRCTGGRFSRCALGYEGDYCAKCSTKYDVAQVCGCF